MIKIKNAVFSVVRNIAQRWTAAGGRRASLGCNRQIYCIVAIEEIHRPATAMPPFDYLTDEEIWQLVIYLRSLIDHKWVDHKCPIAASQLPWSRPPGVQDLQQRARARR
jgi:hypothetical protein